MVTPKAEERAPSRLTPRIHAYCVRLFMIRVSTCIGIPILGKYSEYCSVEHSDNGIRLASQDKGCLWVERGKPKGKGGSSIKGESRSR